MNKKESTDNHHDNLSHRSNLDVPLHYSQSMTPRADLIPTTITDKNGKTTTVHKKPQKNTASASLPSPQLPQQQSIEQLRTAVTERIIELYDRTHQSGFDYRPYLIKDTATYPEEHLRVLEQAVHQDTDLADGVAECIVHDEPMVFIKETIHYYQKTDSNNFWVTLSEVRALSQYTAVSVHPDLSEVDEQTQQQCLALMKFTRLIDTPTGSPFLDYNEGPQRDSRVINNDDLATLITERPEDTERIAGIVLARQTSDAAIINGLLDGALPALADGHL